MNKYIKQKKAFTLVELLIAIAIIGILFIVLVSKVDFATDKAKAAGVQTDFRSFQLALETVAKENSGFNTFGWDTGDLNGNRIKDRHDEGDTNKNGVRDDDEVWTGRKVYSEEWTGIYTLTNPADANDNSAFIALEDAINKNLDPELQISIGANGKIIMANGYQDPWKTEYEGIYLSNATGDKMDRGGIVFYSKGADQSLGLQESMFGGNINFNVSNKVNAEDDYAIATFYTMANGYGEVKTITHGFSENQTFNPSMTGSILGMTVENLQKQYDFNYFDSISNAMNNIGGSAEQGSSSIGVYEDNGEKFIVLLNDSIIHEQIVISEDLNLNLGGHKLQINDTVGLKIDQGEVKVNGTLPGSSIELASSGTNKGRVFQVGMGASCIVNGGTYKVRTDNVNDLAVFVEGTMVTNDATFETIGQSNTIRTFYIPLSGNLTLNNTKVKTSSLNGNAAGLQNYGTVKIKNTLFESTQTAPTSDFQAYGFMNYAGGTLVAEDVEVKVSATNGKAYGVANLSTMTLTNVTINAASNYGDDGSGYTDIATGIQNNENGVLELYDCYVRGVHSGVSNSGTIYIDGGIYEGYGHGGIYVSCIGKTAYLENATFRQCDMPAGYTDLGSGTNEAGMYIGGSSGRDNITVYMNNCNVESVRQTIVLRGTSGEQNNALYISNTTLNVKHVRIDNDTHKLYVGVGCNIVGEDTTRPSSVVITNETYTRP